MPDDVVIKAEGLGKRYAIDHLTEREPYTALRDVLAHGVRRAWRKAADLASGRILVQGGATEELWALRDVSFEVRRGEVLGIIGRNGAGKSTLLKILSRITEPSEGRATIKGRVASLLEVGTGFHHELTGRENVYLNGAILGMTRAEIRKKFDEIIAFAEVETFLDTPIKRYSSGMSLRLAFAVAAHLEPEILIVDEVLAIGDAEFQKKCLGKMGEVAKSGRTILFVSHNMPAIRHLCGRAILLVSGRVTRDGESNQTTENYIHGLDFGVPLNSLSRVIETLPPDPAFRLRRIDVAQEGVSTTNVSSSKPIQVSVEYDVFEKVSGLQVYLSLFDLDETLLLESLHNGDRVENPPTLPGRYISQATIPGNFLAGRCYDLRINAGIHFLRECIPQPSPIAIKLEVTELGTVNAAYPGYVTPGRIAPMFLWTTEKVL